MLILCAAQTAYRAPSLRFAIFHYLFLAQSTPLPGLLCLSITFTMLCPPFRGQARRTGRKLFIASPGGYKNILLSSLGLTRVNLIPTSFDSKNLLGSASDFLLSFSREIRFKKWQLLCCVTLPERTSEFGRLLRDRARLTGGECSFIH